MRPFKGLSLCLAATCWAGAADLLHFDFNDTAHLAAEPAPLPAGEILGPVTPAGDFPGSADFRGGALKRAGFRSPQGPFSVEALFRIRKFPPEDGRFTAELVNTATWDIGRTQGFDTRVGGAYLYPVLPRSAYRTEAEWNKAQGGYSHINAGRMSVCFPTFVIAREDDQRLWKQVFADRCIEPNTWTHLVTVWDGTAMRLYLNGLDATDPWRITFPEARPYLDTVVDLFVGARNAGAWDMVPFDGVIDYVKMEDVALSPAQIHERYQATFVPGKRDSLCWGVVVPIYPEAGQISDGRLHIETKVFNHGACTDPDFIARFLAGDSVAIEIAKNPDFLRPGYRGLRLPGRIPGPGLLARPPDPPRRGACLGEGRRDRRACSGMEPFPAHRSRAFRDLGLAGPGPPPGPRPSRPAPGGKRRTRALRPVRQARAHAFPPRGG
jgi:hypothetical protein